jgi:hypothetical protein
MDELFKEINIKITNGKMDVSIQSDMWKILGRFLTESLKAQGIQNFLELRMTDEVDNAIYVIHIQKQDGYSPADMVRMMKDNAKAILDYADADRGGCKRYAEIPMEQIEAMRKTQEEISTKPSIDKLMNFRYGQK